MKFVTAKSLQDQKATTSRRLTSLHATLTASATAADLLTISATAASADIKPVVSSFDLPLVQEADGTWHHYAPVRYAGFEMTTWLKPDPKTGALSGIVEVA